MNDELFIPINEETIQQNIIKPTTQEVIQTKLNNTKQQSKSFIVLGIIILLHFIIYIFFKRFMNEYD